MSTAEDEEKEDLMFPLTKYGPWHTEARQQFTNALTSSTLHYTTASQLKSRETGGGGSSINWETKDQAIQSKLYIHLGGDGGCQDASQGQIHYGFPELVRIHRSQIHLGHTHGRVREGPGARRATHEVHGVRVGLVLDVHKSQHFLSPKHLPPPILYNLQTPYSFSRPSSLFSRRGNYGVSYDVVDLVLTLESGWGATVAVEVSME
ncbi:Uu.00g133850.m01.CDS01 [Anthostomella pinea]|uniref:Uu.00g133850.m01.CDS01 n=1 Tax=Anthostomella pinea TaxID=933095 RepID=A0AAI8VNW6_9PEZI|nr:Uu.00g133850.m01.CDS01 [Anthostomella pinea]